MATTVLSASRIVCDQPADWIAIDDGTIVELGGGDAPRGAVDLGDAILGPGFVDLQINGIADVDFSDCTPDDYRRAEALMLAHGVTSFLPTLISAPLDSYARKLGVLAEAGALGVHLEGPFLGGAPGAHRREFLMDADVAWMTRELARHPRLIRMVTLAPEADLGLELTRMLSGSNVLVALGHSTCTYDEALAGAAAGARAVTHLFNGMGPLHHREPGLAGAALDDDRFTPTLIADLVHVHPAALRLAIARKRNVALVSDAIAIDASWAASRGITETVGAPRLPDGTLAGSTLTLDRAVRNVVASGIEIVRAIEMASTIPARLADLDDRGAIATGMRADLVALDPDDLTVRTTWKAGKRV